MSNADENNNKLILNQRESGLVRVGNSVAITNRILNQEIRDLFNQGFCKLNSKTIKSVDRDYLFELEHSSNHQIVKDFRFRAENRPDYEQALDLFNQVLQIKPNHSLTYTMIGILYINWSDCSISNDTGAEWYWGWEAFAALNRAIEMNSRNALARYYRAQMEEGSWFFGNNTGRLIAIDSLTWAIDLDSKFIQAYTFRGILKYLRERQLDELRSLNERYLHENYSEAMTDFENAIKLDKSYSSGYYWRGKLRGDLKEYQGAIDDFTVALKLREKNKTDLFRMRGEMKLKIGDKDGANRDFEQDKIVNKFIKL